MVCAARVHASNKVGIYRAHEPGLHDMGGPYTYRVAFDRKLWNTGGCPSQSPWMTCFLAAVYVRSSLGTQIVTY